MAVEGRTQKPVVDYERCGGCDLCRFLCPELCITHPAHTGAIEIDLEYCKGCGICDFVCPKKAMKMVREE